MFPVDSLSQDGLVVQRRHETLAFERDDFDVAAFLWIFGAADVGTRRQDVGNMGRLVSELPLVLDTRGPMRDQGRGRTAFVTVSLELAERSVAHVCPTLPVAGSPAAGPLPLVVVSGLCRIRI